MRHFIQPIRGGTIFTTSIQTPQLLSILVLKSGKKYNLLPNVVSKNCWVNGKQC